MIHIVTPPVALPGVEGPGLSAQAGVYQPKHDASYFPNEHVRISEG